MSGFRDDPTSEPEGIGGTYWVLGRQREMIGVARSFFFYEG